MTNEQEKQNEIVDIAPDQIETLPYDEVVKLENTLNNKILNSPLILGGKAVIGSGNKVFKFDPEKGIWLGNANFSDAPFRVNMDGNLVAEDIQIVRPFTYGESISKGDAVYVASGDYYEALLAQQTNSDSNYGFSDTSWRYQVFLTNIDSARIKSVYLYLYSLSGFTSTNVTVSIRAVVPSGSYWIPTGNDLVSKTENITLTAGSTLWQKFAFDTPLKISRNTRYAFIVKSAPITSGEDIYVKGKATGDYANGHAGYTNNSGNTWTPLPLADLTFIIYHDWSCGEAGKVYKTSAFYNDERIYNFIGIAKEDGNAGDVKNVQISGIVSDVPTITVGKKVYLGNLSGIFDTFAGRHEALIGIAISPTEILLMPGQGVGFRGAITPQLVSSGAVPTDDIIAQADITRKTNSTSYVKLKEITIRKGGTYRITFDLASTGGAYTARARIYKNGTPIGTERVVASATFSTFSEDISGWTPGDLCQLYGYINSSSQFCYVRNFRLKGKEKFEYSPTYGPINAEIEIN